MKGGVLLAAMDARKGLAVELDGKSRIVAKGRN